MEDERVLAALLDLRLALGELQAAMTDIDQAVVELIAAERGIKRGRPELDDSSEPPQA